MNYAIIPNGNRDWIEAEFFETEDEAIQEAYDWSSRLFDQTIHICKRTNNPKSIQGWDVIDFVSSNNK